MGILRSEEMRSGTLVLPVDRTRHFIDLIGNKVDMQFEDMHAQKMAPKRPYKKFVQRIEEMERMLRFLFETIKQREGFEDNFRNNNIDNFIEFNHYYKLEGVETEIKKAYEDLTGFKSRNEELIKINNAAIEEHAVVEGAARFQAIHLGGGREIPQQNIEMERIDLEGLGDTAGKDGPTSTFSHVAGVVPAQERDRFARFLFRSTRGNAYTYFDDHSTLLTDPSTGKKVEKSVFVIYYQDSRAKGSTSAMANRVVNACRQFDVNTYPWISNQDEVISKTKMLQEKLSEQEKATEGFEKMLRDNCGCFFEQQNSGNSLIEDWRLFCLKEKSIYTTLNYFDGETTLRCDVWYVAEQEEEIKALLQQHSSGDSSNAILVTDHGLGEHPPTFFKTNEFLAAPMEMVHTYGIPRYQELTPVIFTSVTFPFLFGVMFSDFGHGMLLLLAGLALIYYGEDLRYSQPDLFKVRYLIFMMGFFAMYAGFLYNDFFCLGMNFFGSRWEHGPDGEEMIPKYDIYNGQIPKQGTSKMSDEELKTLKGTGPYPMGVDPAWHGATNELQYMNSLKMKLSVILGVVQMMLGLSLRVANAVYERSILNLCTECVPMIIFMVSFFAYMDYMICYKWVNHIDVGGAPSLVNNLIAMAMFSDLSSIQDKDQDKVVSQQLWDGEKATQSMLMCFALATIPFMLIMKPWLLWIRSKIGTGYQRLDDEVDPQAKSKKPEEEDFSDVVIHQVIETIEYVLGTVSHTASYLRLWALSLAHQQLSLVFFRMTIASAFDHNSWIVMGIHLYFMFAMWFGITVAILMGMDTMECFLHTLRLHWVEFQSKFYKGDGVEFKSYRHTTTLQSASE